LFSFSAIICRKIWSCVRLYTLPNFCCTVLHSLWPCGYVVYSKIRLHCNTLLLLLCFSIDYYFPLFTASIGISFLQFTNLNCMRNLIIIGLTLFLGISVPQFFDQYWTPSRHGLVHTNAGWVSLLFLSQTILYIIK